MCSVIPYSAKLWWGETWRIWRILSDSPKFYPAKNAFRKSRKSAITVYKYKVSTWHANDFHVNLDVLSLCQVETKLSGSHCKKVPSSVVSSANAKAGNFGEIQ